MFLPFKVIKMENTLWYIIVEFDKHGNIEEVVGEFYDYEEVKAQYLAEYNSRKFAIMSVEQKIVFGYKRD